MGKTCYANNGSQCRVLTVGKCKGDGCAFYKTILEQNESNKLVKARISLLDKAFQRYIAEKYYKGRYPWLEAGE